MQQKFNLWANCFQVKGYCKALLQDVQKGVYTYLQKNFDKFNELRCVNNDLIMKYGYFDLKHQYLFPKLSIETRWTSLVSNAEICFTGKFGYNKVFYILERLNCKAIYIRILFFSPSIFESLFRLINKYAFQTTIVR